MKYRREFIESRDISPEIYEITCTKLLSDILSAQLQRSVEAILRAFELKMKD